MKYEQIKNILITTGYTQQHDKDEVLDYINEIQQENKQLKDNWNKLKKWLEEYNTANEKWYNNELSNHDKEYYKKDYLDCKFFVNKFANEMQELEKSDSNGQ